MKKAATILTAIFLSAIIYAQGLDTVQVSLTLRAQDWAWLVGKYGHGNDSTDKAEIRNIRTQLQTANPPNWTTNVQVTSVSGPLIIFFYNSYANAGFNEVLEMGATNNERMTIYNNIRALNSPTIQYYIGVLDGNMSGQYINTRKRGKEILLDN